MLATLTQREKEAIKSGNTVLLKKHLTNSLECIMGKLLTVKEDVRFVQGEAYAISELLKLI